MTNYALMLIPHYIVYYILHSYILHAYILHSYIFTCCYLQSGKITSRSFEFNPSILSNPSNSFVEYILLEASNITVLPESLGKHVAGIFGMGGHRNCAGYGITPSTAFPLPCDVPGNQSVCHNNGPFLLQQ